MEVLDFTKERFAACEGVIIYGAGVWGKIVFETLEDWGEKTILFVDRFKKGEYLGQPIIQIDMLKDLLNYDVLICAPSAFEDVCINLKDVGFKRIFHVSSVLRNANIKTHTNWQDRMPPEKLLEIYTYYKDRIDKRLDRLVIPQLSFSITEACTLKCEKCNALMPYYKNPRTFKYTEYLEAMNRLLDVVDEIYEVGFIGGEAFINGELDKYIEWAVQSDKIDSVLVVTNATIIPEQRVIDSLKHEKVFLCLDDYGNLSKAIKQLEKIAIAENINYYILKDSYWYDFGGVHKKNYSEYQLQEIFNKCSIRDCNFFLKGKFYRCQYSGNLINLGLCQADEDSVDFNIHIEREKLREKVGRLITQKGPLESCEFCNNIERSSIIPVAMQLSDKKRCRGVEV